MTHKRRQGRILAMQALCQWDVHREESSPDLEDFLAEQQATTGAQAAAAAIVKDFWSRRRQVDRLLAHIAENWDLSRISPVERNVMRVAVVELLAQSAPARAVVNEAIEIAREYGGEDSPRFVNGILDAVLRQLEKEAKEQA